VEAPGGGSGWRLWVEAPGEGGDASRRRMTTEERHKRSGRRLIGWMRKKQEDYWTRVEGVGKKL